MYGSAEILMEKNGEWLASSMSDKDKMIWELNQKYMLMKLRKLVNDI